MWNFKISSFIFFLSWQLGIQVTIYLFVFLMQTSKTQIQLFPPKSSTLSIYVGHNEEKNLLFNKITDDPHQPLSGSQVSPMKNWAFSQLLGAHGMAPP